MIKVLLIDDDFLARTFLRQVINWEQEGFELLEGARDGEEALELYDKFQPELIITDLSMPLMNGIELIKKLKEKQDVPEIIVLSCHDDFFYVKEALQLGIVDYVLKSTMEPQVLLNILEKAKKIILEKKELTSEVQQQEIINEEAKYVLQKTLIHSLVTKKIEQEEQNKILNTGKFQGEYYNCSLMLIQLAKGISEISLNCLQESQKKLAQFSAEMIFFEEGIYLILIDLEKDYSLFQQLQKMGMIVNIIQKVLLNNSYVDFSIGISSNCMGEGSIYYAYKQAREALNHSFYQAGVFYYNSINKFEERMPEITLEFTEKLPRLIRNKEEKSIQERYEQCREFLKLSNVEPNLIIKWVKGIDAVLKIARAENYYEKIIYLEDIDLAFQIYIEQAKMSGIIEDSEINNELIKEAIDYIRLNCELNLSLSEIAELFHLNPAYFSFLFKKQTGVNFSRYVLSCRIEKAKYFLEHTEESAKRVSEQCGFNDYGYFCKVFKKLEDLKPVDYRKNKKSFEK